MQKGSHWILLIPALLLTAENGFAEVIFRCAENAKSSRNFPYVEKAPGWCGVSTVCGPKESFEVKLFPKALWEDLSYRESLLSIDLKSKTVLIKSFWSKDDDGKPFSEEFRAQIISITEDAIFFSYSNPTGNKLHSYALDKRVKKLVTASVMQGLTSLVVESRTFDCE